MTSTQADKPPTRIDADAFVAEAQRITNEAHFDDLLALYHPDAIANWSVNGVTEHHEGIEAIRNGARVMTNVWRDNRFRIAKTLECADDETIVLSWRGGYRGKMNQAGTEIWKLRDGLVINHRIDGTLQTRSSTSLRGKVRILAAAPGFAVSVLKNQRQVAREIWPESTLTTRSAPGNGRTVNHR